MIEIDPTDEWVEVDPYDEDDAVKTEIAVALAIKSVLSNPIDAKNLDKRKAESILDSAVRVPLTHYSQRVLTDFLSGWQGSSPVRSFQYEALQAAVRTAVNKVISDTAGTVVEIAKAAESKAKREPGVTYEQGLHDDQAEAFSRLRTGMEGVSRLLTTRSREESKLEYATRLGALGRVWRTRKDPKVRTAHADLEGHFERMGDPFPAIDGSDIEYPGDPSAPLSQTINCRCRLSYRMPVAK